MNELEFLESSADSLARVHKAEAIGALVDVMRNGHKDSDRLRAAELLLDRGYGKAAQAIISVPARQAISRQLASMSDEQLLSIAAAARSNLQNERGVAPQARDPDVRTAPAALPRAVAEQTADSSSYDDIVDADFDEIVDPLS